MISKFEVDTIIKGIETSWTTWGKMRGENLVLGPVNYLKADGGNGFERIYSVNIQENQDFEIQQMISYIKAGIMPDSILITPNTEPSDLTEILSEKGFIINDKDPCMILYLDNYQSYIMPIDNFTVSAVTTREQLAEWLNIVNVALFECELVSLDQFNDVFVLDNTCFYLGFIDNKPVTACMTMVTHLFWKWLQH